MTKRKRRLLKNELQVLTSSKLVIRAEVAQYVTQVLKKKLFYVSPLDQLHLLKLQVWSDKYMVPVSYILDILIEYYGQWMKRFKSARGLGVKIPTLTGHRSKTILLERIETDFPNNEHKFIWRQTKQAEIIRERMGEATDPDEDEPQVRVRHLSEFKNPKAYVRYYNQSIDHRRKRIIKVSTDVHNKRRPYRSNPWF